MQNSKIEWTNHTANLWWGCTEVHEGCDNCYAIEKHWTSIDWVIQGGESGHHKRPFDLQWAYSMKAQCEAAGVPYFFKQIDKVQAIPEDLQIHQFP